MQIKYDRDVKNRRKVMTIKEQKSRKNNENINRYCDKKKTTDDKIT